MTDIDKLQYLRRDLSGIRHDWAKVLGWNTVVTMMIDEVMAQMDKIIEIQEHLGKLRARELRQYREDNL